MRIFGLPLGTIGKIATGVGNVLSFAAMIVLPLISKKDATVGACCNNDETYDSVIMEIMNSSMLSNDKTKAVKLIPKDGDGTLYKAITNVITSNMLSNDKIKVIECICDN